MSSTTHADALVSTGLVTGSAGRASSPPPRHPRPPHQVGVPMLAWGHNSSAGLGLRHTAAVLRPNPGRLPAGTVDVQGGTDFSVALTSHGTVWCWGGNRWGQLGDGTTKHAFSPRQVKLPLGTSIVAIAVGQDHVLALSRRGRVYAWGRNNYGQVGDGTRTDRHRPVSVPITDSVAHIAAGNTCSLAVRSSGSLSGWGNSVPLGSALAKRAETPHALRGSAEDLAVTRPHKLVLPARTEVKATSAGQRHLVVLTRDGQLLQFGRNGTGRPAVHRLHLERSWGRVVAISSGDNHTLALTRSGVVLAWGGNHFGQLGLPSTASHDNPVPVGIRTGRAQVVQVLANGNSSLARTENHHLFAWGDGGFGQQGRGSTQHAQRPERVDIPRVEEIYAGRYHYFAVTR